MKANVIGLIVGVLFLGCGMIALGVLGWFEVSILFFVAGCLITPLSFGGLMDACDDANREDITRMYREIEWEKDLNK